MASLSKSTALHRWLQFVALLRIFSVVLGYVYPGRIQENVYNNAPNQVTELQARTFATWTLTSCMLCLLCARYPSVVPIYAATLGSFIIALLHFISELFIYETVSIKTAIQPLIVASISTLWMGAGWNYYTSAAAAPVYSEDTTQKTE